MSVKPGERSVAIAVPRETRAENERHGSSFSGLSAAASVALPPDEVTRWLARARMRGVPRARPLKLDAVTGPPPRAAVRGQVCRNAVTEPGAGGAPAAPLRRAAQDTTAPRGDPGG